MKLLIILSSLLILTKSQESNPCESNYGQVIANPESCDSYIICVLSEPHFVDCPIRTVFSVEKRECVRGNPATCTIYDFDAICKDVFFGARPFPDDETLFIACIRNMPAEMQCYQYEIFDSSLNECVYIGPPETTESTTTSSTTTSSTTTSTTTTSTLSTTTSTTTTTENPNPCYGINNGQAANPEECTKCFYCFNQQILPIDCVCGAGQIFWINECVNGNTQTCQPDA